MANSTRDFGTMTAKEVYRKGYRLCNDHFDKGQFVDIDESGKKKPQLKWNAVPTMFQVGDVVL